MRTLFEKQLKDLINRHSKENDSNESSEEIEMSAFNPELGQLAFGQPHQEYSVPNIMEAALGMISDEFDRVMWNKHQKQIPNPFHNTGGRFECQTFVAHAYSWREDDQPFNFKWRDLEISWYKWMGRGMSSNVEITPQLASECLDECLACLLALEEQNENETKGET